jgi:branched-subunit amino acid transport protein AzlD
VSFQLAVIRRRQAESVHRFLGLEDALVIASRPCALLSPYSVSKQNSLAISRLRDLLPHATWLLLCFYCLSGTSLAKTHLGNPLLPAF